MGGGGWGVGGGLIMGGVGGVRCMCLTHVTTFARSHMCSFQL
jgi:hypothetical protein